MRLRLILHPVARQEFKDAVAWYSKQKKGLGKKFSKAVRQEFKRLQATPKMHAIVSGDVRKATVKGFPFIIPYRVATNEIIVISVFHTKQDPSIWQERI